MNPLSPQDLDRIRFVTRHFHDLQGLRSKVPMGLLCLVLGLLSLANEHVYVPSPGLALLALALLVAGAGASWWMARWARSYYTSRFGEVERREVNPLGPWGRRGAVVLALTLVLFLFTLPSPEALTRAYCLIGGAWACGLWVRRGSRLCQAHYLGFGVLALGLAAPVRALDSLVLLLSKNVGLFLAVGCFLVVTGLLDHLVLVRTLRQLAPEPRAQPSVAPSEARR